jgi:GSCFA family
MDDLRDYRFYESDMIHPSPIALDYIWKKFGQRHFSTDTQHLNDQIESVKKSLAHKAFHPETSAHQLFLKEMLKKC